eukprot:IDg8766t1
MLVKQVRRYARIARVDIFKELVERYKPALPVLAVWKLWKSADHDQFKFKAEFLFYWSKNNKSAGKVEVSEYFIEFIAELYKSLALSVNLNCPTPYGLYEIRSSEGTEANKVAVYELIAAISKTSLMHYHKVREAQM